MFEAVVDRTGRAYGFHYNLLGVGPRFEADNGFVARTGFVQPNVANRFTIFGRPGGLFERYNLFVTANAIWRYDDFFAGRSLLEDRVGVSNTVTFRRGWSVSVNPATASYAFDPARYASLYAPGPSFADAPVPFAPSDRLATFGSTFSVATPQFRRFSASLSTSLVNDVDFLRRRAPGAATSTPRSTCGRTSGCASPRPTSARASRDAPTGPRRS